MTLLGYHVESSLSNLTKTSLRNLRELIAIYDRVYAGTTPASDSDRIDYGAQIRAKLEAMGVISRARREAEAEIAKTKNDDEPPATSSA